jgi:hypothetical protein
MVARLMRSMWSPQLHLSICFGVLIAVCVEQCYVAVGVKTYPKP